MNEEKPAPGVEENGVSAWIKVPPGVAADVGAAPTRFSVDFSIRLRQDDLGLLPGDVAPARPTGKTIAAGSSVSSTDGMNDGDGGGRSAGCACAELRRTESHFRLTIPPLDPSDPSSYQVEIGPLSYSQGWLDGRKDYEGYDNNDKIEPTGRGPIWRDKQRVVLISLISAHALQQTPPTPSSTEFGIFAWIKLAKAPPGQQRPYLFEADFVADFVPKAGGNGAVTRPTPPSFDVSGASTTFLASIDLPEGRWTLSAKGAAAQPPARTYSVAVGPRSAARAWMAANGKSWCSDAAVFALITLTTRHQAL